MQEALFHESCDCSSKRAPEARLCRLQTLLEKLQYMLDDLPAVMRQWVVAELGHQSRDEFDKNVDSPEVAHAQLEITRANLHFTHLWLQNYLLEKIDLILQQQVSDASVTSDTASASAALPFQQVHIEPNGLYLVGVQAFILTFGFFAKRHATMLCCVTSKQGGLGGTAPHN
ncbi:hypothetical protein HYQ45_007636 [Verticillium longisporum]|uniref:Uncharacterized protein n=1 Tax=Verticillium longisporum TaxID=100787 RepID=A0A8I3AQ42_VERLO|nr:hypothetical protein HYQ45_007636 [Verticillium longisporum]